MEIRVISSADLRKCPITSLDVNHYRDDGTCLCTLRPGDPIPPERTGWMAGFVAGNCGHRVAGSEWRAGFRNCERCGEDPS